MLYGFSAAVLEETVLEVCAKNTTIPQTPSCKRLGHGEDLSWLHTTRRRAVTDYERLRKNDLWFAQYNDNLEN